MIRIGLIGFGYWGPNLARNFHSSPHFDLACICDYSSDRLKTAARLYPQAKLLNRVDGLFNSSDLDAVAIATPVSTHFGLARQALLADKHVWLEKPMTEKIEQSEQLIELSQKRNKTLIVDHTFVYTGSVRKIKEIVDQGELGELIYYDSIRVNLGLFQQDVDVIWDLAAHDLSIMDYLMPMKKLAVSATGSEHYGGHMIPKALLTIYMERNTIGHINVSWLSPVKIRQTLIGGTSKMILYEDNNPSEKVKVYDKGVELYPTKEELYRIKIQYRVGDMYAPRVDDSEALALETEHFAGCIEHCSDPVTCGRFGLEVVKVLVASKESLRQRGAPVELR